MPGSFQIIRFTSVTSTQDIARMLMRDRVVVVADEQRDGRGRKGRRWLSPLGGLWFTVILKNPPELITLAAAVAVAESLANLGYKAGIKWPNDIIYGGKKLGGIIAEKLGEYVLLGIGINLRNEIPHEVRDIATRIPEIEHNSLLLAVLDSLDLLIGMSPEEIIERWKKYSITLGKNVCVPDENLCGIAVDVDTDGALLVRTEEGIRRIYAGDVLIQMGD